MPGKIVLAAVVLSLFAAPVLAGPMREATEICSDPMTSEPRKNEILPARGWETAPIDEAGGLTDLAMALIIGFTNGMPDLAERFAAAPRLAANFATLAEKGEVRLWQKDGALLAVSIAKTPEGREHLGCYLAMPPDDETLDLMREYGGIEELPELELLARRFDETAFRTTPDATFAMVSSWTRQTSDPARTPLTDGYRLERVEQP
ncbi:MAG: YdeI/OmpD-associated family protein [Rhodobacteraceae bacterium]|nr:YdeI/OmpD-associated family protein [Paracoccaceae bacterium]